MEARAELEQREKAIDAVRDDPHVKINREAVDALYVRPGSATVAAPAAGNPAPDPASTGATAPTGVPGAGATTPRRPGTPPPGLTGGTGTR
jgi:hypothetical protein